MTYKYKYDSTDKVIEIIVYQANGTVLAIYTYSDDQGGRLTGEVNDGVRTTYIYNGNDNVADQSF